MSERKLQRLLDEYIPTKDKYKAQPHRHTKQRKRLKRRYQELERKIIPIMPDEYRYQDRILFKGHNDFGEHIQVFTKASLQRRKNHAEVLGHSADIQRIIQEEK